IRLGGSPGGIPRLSGLPWQLSFSHSGQAAFCALRHCENAKGILGLDAEHHAALPPASRAFTQKERKLLSASTALARWTIKEALLKALETGLASDPALLEIDRLGLRRGRILHAGHRLSWRLLTCPGHWLSIAEDTENPPSPTVRWLPVQAICADRFF
ncbi:MAG: 4'-phosphopantetheinyl transferase superfamily protein, partial [Desulfovibrionaceae bacterium]|nr:4'-phosphopantetheinyl transferase superfamily protein [Desulfovibrionaceae bacterium]